MPMIAPPRSDEFAPPFGNYIAKVPAGDILQIRRAQLRDAREMLQNLSDEESLKHHAPYTWSIRQVIGHVTDAERVFACRALWIARNDTTPLPSFDETAWMSAVDFDRIPLQELVN